MNSMGIYQHHRRHVPRFVWVWLLAIPLVLAVGGGLGAFSALPADATPPKHHKVTICHNGHSITVADDGYWGGHIHHPGDTLGACPVEPTEEPTWTPDPTPEPEPSVTSSASPTTSPSPTVSPEPTEPSASPEPSVSVSATPTPSSPSPSPTPTPSVTPSPSPSATHPSATSSPAPTSSPSSSPVPSVTSTLSPLPVLPTAETSAVPYTAPDQLAATGMSDAGRAALGVAASLLIIGTILVLARRKENQS